MKKHRLSQRIRIFMLIAVASLLALTAAPSSASVCTLADHIRSANTNTAVGFCPAGTSHDIITIADDIALTEPLPPITGTITIEGGGHAISGEGQFRIFDIQRGNLTIRNLTLTDGKAEHGGAVRLQAGALTVYESSFVGNRSETSAGAIYANGGTLQINNSRFEDNCAQLATYALKEGVDRDSRSVDADGCVRVSYTRSEIDGDVQTKVDGGAIRLLNGAQATVENSTFADNRATYGGAISTSSRADKLVVNGSSFLGNHASESGGAIGAVWSGGGTSVISNSSFVDNSAGNAAGAIDAKHRAMNISNSTFSQNHTDGDGGALQVGWDATVTVTHATFIDNRARGEGDAIRKTEGTLFLRNSIIVGAGRADDCVGGLDQDIGNLSPDRTCGVPLGSEVLLDEIAGSPAYYAPLDLSPAVDVAVAEYCLGTDQLGIERPQGGGCDIGAIESTTAKPAPYVAPPFCALPDQIIAANTDRPYRACPAGNGADTIYLVRDFVLTDKLQPITSHITIEGNGYTISGDRKFRIFDVDGGLLTIKNLTITEGRGGSGGGGAIRLQNNGRAAVSDSRFVDNQAGSGGAIFIGWQGADNSWITVNNSQLVDNGNSAIYAGSGMVSVTNSSFRDNWGGAGGGIGMVNHSTRLDVENSSFISNSNSAIGLNNGATATLTHVTIHHGRNPPVLMREDSFTSPASVNLRNSIIAGRGFAPEDCDNLRQNIGNLIEDGSCSPMLSGDPMLAQATDESAYLDLQAGSPAIGAADARFCPDTDQIGRSRATVGRCDIGAVESLPVRQSLSDCSVTTTHGLNLRDDPNGKIVGAVPIEETLAPLARTDGWFHVEYQGAEGWISAHYVVMQGDCR